MCQPHRAEVLILVVETGLVTAEHGGILLFAMVPTGVSTSQD
jgi:hypothetical protein